MVGTCKLCSTPGVELKQSHVIPDFFIRGLEHELVTGNHGKAQPFSILLSARSEIEGGVKQRGVWERVLGIKEYLLCDRCEQKFQRNETYVRNLLYGNTPQPLKKLPLGSCIADFTGQPECDGLLAAQKAMVDYKRLKLFQLSLLWRAGIAKGPFFKEVDLGEFHEAKLKKLLVTESPGSDADYCCTMVNLRHKEKGCEDWIETPRRSKDGHQVGYQFIIGGYMYLFTVSKSEPRPSAQLCSVKSTGEVILIVADATRILRSRVVALHKLGRI